MTNICKNCGCTEAQAIADAKTLGLTQEFQSGVYSCCQIADWPQEQWLAWVEATQQDIDRAAEPTKQSGHDAAGGARDGVDLQAVLVPVRFRKPVPWFKTSDGWR